RSWLETAVFGTALPVATILEPIENALVRGFEGQRCIGAAKPKGVVERDPNPGRACGVRNVVKIALGVRVLLVDSRRNHVVLQREYRKRGFDCAGGAQGVTGHRLGRADRDFCSAFAEDLLDRLGLSKIALGRGCSVRVYVVNLVRIKVAVF